MATVAPPTSVWLHPVSDKNLKITSSWWHGQSFLFCRKIFDFRKQISTALDRNLPGRVSCPSFRTDIKESQLRRPSKVMWPSPTVVASRWEKNLKKQTANEMSQDDVCVCPWRLITCYIHGLTSICDSGPSTERKPVGCPDVLVPVLHWPGRARCSGEDRWGNHMGVFPSMLMRNVQQSWCEMSTRWQKWAQ